MQWYEKHYKQCEKYIYAVQHPTEFTREELNKIVVEQRISSSELSVCLHTEDKPTTQIFVTF